MTTLTLRTSLTIALMSDLAVDWYSMGTGCTAQGGAWEVALCNERDRKQNGVKLKFDWFDLYITHTAYQHSRSCPLPQV
jgi:hypothetical protein